MKHENNCFVPVIVAISHSEQHKSQVPETSSEVQQVKEFTVRR
jgi:hypothetical protein